MQSEEKIEVGDEISIYWENVPNLSNATVLHVPESWGDIWIVKDRSGHIHYIDNFSRMSKLVRKITVVPRPLSMSEAIDRVRNPQLYDENGNKKEVS